MLAQSDPIKRRTLYINSVNVIIIKIELTLFRLIQTQMTDLAEAVI